MKVNGIHNRAVTLTLKSKRSILAAVITRLEQPEGFDRARAAVEKVLEKDGSDYEAIVAGGDAYFAFIKETCGVGKP